jgi:protein-S-isoprenylcysteine O-methyltransferase Ste14
MRTRFTWVWALGFILICLFSGSAWEPNFPIVPHVLFGIAVALVACSICGRLWCSVYIVGYKTDQLIQSGPYSISRNPLYFFSWLGGIGIAMGSQTILLPAIVAIAFLIYYPWVIASEEAVLEARHGEAFTDYKAKVPRFFPAWSLLSEPEDYSMKPIIFRRHLCQVIWFALFLSGLAFIHGLHAAGVLPVLFKIY